MRKVRAHWGGKPTTRSQVYDYAMYITQPFSYKNIVADLGLTAREVGRVMHDLREAGELVLVSSPRQGMYLHVSKCPKKIQEARAAGTRAKGEEDVKKAILAAMQEGIIYSSRMLREVAQMPALKYQVLAELAEAGAIDKIEKNKSYYWIKRR